MQHRKWELFVWPGRQSARTGGVEVRRYRARTGLVLPSSKSTVVLKARRKPPRRSKKRGGNRGFPRETPEKPRRKPGESPKARSESAVLRAES